MATTTNFGWETPDDTDLVQQGAAAMRTLGNSIDASFVDLKGGTTNQVLAKNSDTDLDFKWVADASGMTNPMTTTGDTIYSSSGSTPARLGIGATGQVLTVAGGVPSWATPTSSFKGCSIYATSAQSIANSTSTAILYQAENFDTDNFHSTVSNTSRITIPAGLGGKYLFNYSVAMTTGATTGIRQCRIVINNTTEWNVSRIAPSISTEIWMVGSLILNLSAGDYVENVFIQTSGANMSLDSGSTRNYFQCVYLGA